MEEDKELYRKRLEKWVKIFLLFLAFMWLCTIISRSIYVSRLPRVNVQNIEKKYVEHIIEADGIVIAKGEQPVNTLDGIRVQSIKVQEGDFVEKGDVLFSIDLKDLETIINAKETELAKLKYQLSATQFNETLDSQKKELAILWAQEDYNNADSETARIVERAQTDWEEARNKLDEHMKTEIPYTSDSSREAAWNEYNNWKKRGYELSDKITAKEREIKNIENDLNQLLYEGRELLQETNQTFEAENIEKSTEISSELNNIEDIEKTEETNKTEDTEASEEVNATENTEANKTENTKTSSELNNTENSEVTEITNESNNIMTLSGAADNSSEQEELEQALKKANDELATLNNELVKHNRESVKEPDFSEEELAYDAWQQKKTALEDSVEQARRVFEDALYSRSNILMQKKRDLASVEANLSADSTIAIYELEIKNIQAEINKFYELKKLNGEIKAENSGFVSKILIQVGSRTIDSAAILLTDTTMPCQFRFSITKEQGKYMQIGDNFELKINNSGGQKIDATVDYITENTSGGYDIISRLPENIANPGTSGSVHKSVQGEFHSATIPIEALYKENEAYYIYTYNERTGILGKEAYAEKIKVQVIDQNDRFAALESGTISTDTQIITFSSEDLRQGQSIRKADS